MNNAFKFTETGGITVRVDVLKDDGVDEPINEGFLRLSFEVEDTGAGISAGDREKIFEAFEQTKTGRVAKEGTGLGLTISRKFVELMGGRLTVESAVGRGALFRFHIKVQEAEPGSTTVAQEPGRVVAMAEGQTRYRILVVDDNRNNRRLLMSLLEHYDLDLREAEDGKAAVLACETWHPHLVFMDMRMPVMDGYEATGRIKSQDPKGSTKVIAVSASSLKGEQEAILAAGCDACIAKPFRESDIFGALEAHLGIRWVYEPEDALPPEDTPGQTPDWRSLMALVPEPLQEALKDALMRADMASIDHLLIEVAAHSPRLARTLKAYADDFEYEAMLSLITGP